MEYISNENISSTADRRATNRAIQCHERRFRGLRGTSAYPPRLAVKSGHSGSAGSCQTRTSAALIRSPRPRPAKNISAMAKQITLKAPGNRQSLQSIPSGSPVGHRRFWPLIPDDRTGFWRRRPSRPRASPRSRNALSLVYFSRQLMTNCGRSRGRTFCSVACFWQLSTRSFCFARHAASS